MLSSLQHLESKIDSFLEHANGGRPVVLYGAGFALPAILRKLEAHRFNIAAISDSRPELYGGVFDGRYDILAPEKAMARFPDATFVISSPKYFEEIYQELSERISPGQVSDIDLECAHYFKAHEFRDFFSQNRHRLESVLASLADDASRETLTNVIKAHLSGERRHFQQAFTGNDDWYLFRSLLAPHANSVFVDCGAHDGDTVRLFSERASDAFNRIYAFEPDSTMFDSLRELADGDTRIEVINKGAFSREGHVTFNPNGMYSAIVDEGDLTASQIPVTTIDAVLRGQRADIIKMDIEGAEYDALLGAEQTISTHRPRLAICLYHKVEDMLRIPELLLRFVPEYGLHIRHQSESCTDTILFAVAR